MTPCRWRGSSKGNACWWSSSRPAFVKFRGEVSPEAPSFAALVQNLLIRLPMLSAVHCGEIWREDFRALVERANEVETVRDETTWASFRRYSSFRGRVRASGRGGGERGVRGAAEGVLAPAVYGPDRPRWKARRLRARALPDKPASRALNPSHATIPPPVRGSLVRPETESWSKTLAFFSQVDELSSHLRRVKARIPSPRCVPVTRCPASGSPVWCRARNIHREIPGGDHTLTRRILVLRLLAGLVGASILAASCGGEGSTGGSSTGSHPR